VNAEEQLRLVDLPTGRSAHITRVSDAHPDMLRYAAGLGLRPQARLTLLDAEPFGGSLRVRVGRTEHAIGRELAQHIFVTLQE